MCAMAHRMSAVLACTSALCPAPSRCSSMSTSGVSDSHCVWLGTKSMLDCSSAPTRRLMMSATEVVSTCLISFSSMPWLDCR
jgi:hypothetical protein